MCSWVVVYLFEVYCFLEKKVLKQRRNREKVTCLYKEKYILRVYAHKKQGKLSITEWFGLEGAMKII